MRERGISESEAEATMDVPDIMLPSAPGSADVMKRVGGRLIRVVYRVDQATGVRWVVTVYAPEE